MRATKPQLPTVLNLGIKMQVTQRRNYKILTSFTEIITALIAPKSINALFYPFTDRLPRTTRTFHGWRPTGYSTSSLPVQHMYTFTPYTSRVYTKSQFKFSIISSTGSSIRISRSRDVTALTLAVKSALVLSQICHRTELQEPALNAAVNGCWHCSGSHHRHVDLLLTHRISSVSGYITWHVHIEFQEIDHILSTLTTFVSDQKTGGQMQFVNRVWRRTCAPLETLQKFSLK